MQNQIKLTPTEILSKQFTKDVKGYNPDEVDAFLDEVIADYRAFASFVKDSKDYIDKLEMENAKLAKRNHDLETENGGLHSRLDGIKEGTGVTQENMAYIQRISKLEKKLYSLGYNPQEIK